MTIIARIGFAIAFASVFVRPALANQHSPVVPHDRTMPAVIAANTDDVAEPPTAKRHGSLQRLATAMQQPRKA